MSKVKYVVKVGNKRKADYTIGGIEGFPSIRKFVINYLPDSVQIKIHSLDEISTIDELFDIIMNYTNSEISSVELEILSSPYAINRLLSNNNILSLIMNFFGLLNRESYYSYRDIRVKD